jgi:FtsP/CotA-like multicopper oxidase with cupredoxin domain
MTMKRLADVKKYMAIGLGVGALALGTPMTNAEPVTVNLCTGTTMYDPGGANVPMWGFGTDTGSGCNVTVPGPDIPVNEGDVVTINVTNNLSVPVSLIVTNHNVDDLGTNPGPDPVFNPDGRVRSLVAEAAPSGGTASYIVTAKAGSFIYHSATHQQVQVQMGLYGAMTATPATPGYDTAIAMFYSEIDPVLHAAVNDGNYGTANGPTSTIDYKPRYFLVNGAPSDSSTPVAAGATGQDILVRMFNAGLRSRTMQTLGTYMKLVAENGAATPYAKTRHTADVHALGTTDVIINTATPGQYRLYDRRLAHSDGTNAGGINSTLAIASAASAPVADNDSANVLEEAATPINVVDGDTATAPATIDVTTVAIVTDPVHGSADPDGLGNVTYTSHQNYNGSDSFTYTVDDSDGNTSNVATVSVTVINVNDAPVAANDTYEVVAGTMLNVVAPGVLSNDSDADGDPLTASGAGINADGSFSFDASAMVEGDSANLTYTANDGLVDSALATVTINVVAPAANLAPVAVDETVTYSRAAGTFVDPITGAFAGTTINILANDSDADGTLDPASVVLSLTSKRDKNLANGDQGSSVLLLGSGAVSYTPPASGGGTDVFTYNVADNDGAVSNTATVRINLVK